ncbi:MAG: glycosyltransferase family 2 protein [Planctomycetota bacterium]
MDEKKIDISVIIPCFNEEDNIEELHQRLTAVMKTLGKEYEMIFVDDGSIDDTFNRLKRLYQSDGSVKVISFTDNFGQTAALAAGFELNRGEIVVTLDADLQVVPEDIPVLVKKINEGYDMVNGWRKKRMDSLFLRRLPSLIANKIITWISGIKLKDFGSPLKAYRRSVIKNIELYRGAHRFIPVLAGRLNINMAEIPVQHFLRTRGRSHYGLTRTFGVILDLIFLKFSKYLNHPLQFIMTGLLGEMIVKKYYINTGRKIYTIKTILSKDNETILS